MARSKKVDVETGEVTEQKEETAIVISDNSKEAIFRQLEEQYKLPWEVQRDMIRSEGALMQKGVQMAVRTAMAFGLPLQGINVLRNNVYVNSDGIRWRLHTDPRTLKRSDAEIVHRPTKDEPWVEVKATVEMGDGSVYSNYGVVDCAPGAGVGNAIMKTVTKAKRRAGVDAVGVALPIFEEYTEFVAEERKQGRIIDVSYRQVPSESKIEEPTNFAELLAWVSQQGKSSDDALTVSGLTEIGDMANNVRDTWLKLKEAWKK